MLVMEWVDGSDLHRTMLARGGRIPELQALSWMKQVCEGMIAAAAEGIVHRDLKPSNVMIDQHQRARVTDFGLARSRASEEPMITTDGGHALGTPLYMSPEQAEDPRSADTRSDIYSFGAAFYHVLTGRPPFDGESSLAILLKHKLDPLISPKARCPDMSEATSQLLERCLAKSPQDRFQSFQEVLTNLNREETNLAWADSGHGALIPYCKSFAARFHHYVSGNIPQLSDLYEFPGGRRLHITYGDIALQEADAIVSSDNSRLTMSYGVSLAIRRIAGEQIVDEAQRFAPVRSGRVVVTSAGSLRARFVFHGVTIGWDEPDRLIPSRDLIQEIMKGCFYHAETFGVESLAFPLLGTGAAGFGRDMCLDTMFRYLARTLHHGLTPVKNATLVIFGRPAPSGTRPCGQQ
jgi:O-acetyl-ADP-ribose deacetylase (regulator of RNase III)